MSEWVGDNTLLLLVVAGVVIGLPNKPFPLLAAAKNGLDFAYEPNPNPRPPAAAAAAAGSLLLLLDSSLLFCFLLLKPSLSSSSSSLFRFDTIPTIDSACTGSVAASTAFIPVNTQ